MGLWSWIIQLRTEMGLAKVFADVESHGSWESIRIFDENHRVVVTKERQKYPEEMVRNPEINYGKLSYL